MLTLSIILEAAVAIVAVLAARRRRNPYIYGLAFTFTAYVFYDFARLTDVNVEAGVLSILFLLATLSALVAVIGLYRSR